MTIKEKIALLAGDVALHQSIFTLFPTDNPEETHYAMAAGLIDEALEPELSIDKDMSDAEMDFVHAAIEWRAAGQKNDETFAQALNALENLTDLELNPKFC